MSVSLAPAKIVMSVVSFGHKRGFLIDEVAEHGSSRLVARFLKAATDDAGRDAKIGDVDLKSWLFSPRAATKAVNESRWDSR